MLKMTERLQVEVDQTVERDRNAGDHTIAKKQRASDIAALHVTACP